MKTVIVFLILTWIGFGFLLSDNINMRKEVERIQQLNRQRELEVEELQAQLDATLLKLAQSEQTVRELIQQSSTQEEKIRQLNLEIAAYRKQTADLQTKIDALQLLTSVNSSIPNVLSLLMFLPIVPASIGATYMLVRYSSNADRKKMKTTSRDTSVQLTESEVKEIIKLRRMR